mmetsp:Transcript_32837/g.53655  ORF Transcript_32837/g.53655 Transcript_32837/m.53655 type:complete len:103 (+) Transcript_32837:1001-1309(+)
MCAHAQHVLNAHAIPYPYIDTHFFVVPHCNTNMHHNSLTDTNRNRHCHNQFLKYHNTNSYANANLHPHCHRHSRPYSNAHVQPHTDAQPVWYPKHNANTHWI